MILLSILLKNNNINVKHKTFPLIKYIIHLIASFSLEACSPRDASKVSFQWVDWKSEYHRLRFRLRKSLGTWLKAKYSIKHMINWFIN
jgi:hypothetical protein